MTDPLEAPGSLRPEPRKALHNILNTMSGADGGESFSALRILLEQLDQQAQTGDEDAARVIDVVLAFSRLIDTAKRELEKQPTTTRQGDL